jgi:hypothetical protein
MISCHAGIVQMKDDRSFGITRRSYELRLWSARLVYSRFHLSECLELGFDVKGSSLDNMLVKSIKFLPNDQSSSLSSGL